MIIEGQTFLGKPDPAGKVETAAFFLGPDHDGWIVRKCVIDGLSAHWGLKISRGTNLLIEDCVIRGGSERAFDMVGGHNVTFRNCRFERGEHRPTTRSKWSLAKTCDIGIKAGAHDVEFHDCQMNDLLLGDYSIYDQKKGSPKTTGIRLFDCVAANAWPIIARVIHADKPRGDDTWINKLKLPGFAVSLYFAFNRLFGDRRKPTV